MVTENRQGKILHLDVGRLAKELIDGILRWASDVEGNEDHL